jgi:NitT/TauT family transport system substrate-binding protein
MPKKAAACVIAAGILGALALTSCSGSGAGATSEGPTSPAGEPEHGTISVAMVASACLGLYPAYVAQDQGYFAEEGLEVNIEPVNGSAAVLQAMLSGQADLGTPGATPLIFSVAEGSEVKYIANAMPSGSFSIITTAGSGISKPEDLRGKVIGVSTADGGEVAFLTAALDQAGLEEGDYETLVVGEGGQAVAGFTRGDIDAFAAAPDGVATLNTAGLDVTDVTGTRPGHLFGNGLAATGDVIEDRPEAVQAFWNAYEKAVEFGVENPEAVMDTCGKYQPQEIEDPAFAEAMLGAFNKSLETTGGLAYGENDPAHWETIVNDLVDNGELKEGAVDVEGLYTNQFVDAG